MDSSGLPTSITSHTAPGE